MERARSTGGSDQRPKGLRYPVCLTSPHPASQEPFRGHPSDSHLPPNGLTSSEITGASCPSSKPVRFRLHLPAFPGAQGRWIQKTNHKFETAEPVSKPEEIPSHKPFPCTRFSPERRLSRKNRSLSGILSRTDSAFSSEVPVCSIPRHPLLHDLSSVWACLSPSSFCEADQLDCQLSPKSGYESHRLPRRPSPRESRFGSSSFPGSGSSGNPSKPGMVSQLGKISAVAGSDLPIPGDYVEPNPGFKVPSPGETVYHSALPSNSASNSPMVLENRQSPHWVPEFRCLRNSSGETSFPQDPMEQPPLAQNPSPPPVEDSTPGSYPNPMVVSCPSPIIPNLPSSSSSVRVHRCLELGLGSNSRQPFVRGCMVGSSRNVAHKPQGDVCSSQCIRAEASCPTGQSSSYTIRQPNSSILHPQGRRYEVLQTSPRSGSPLRPGSPAQHNSDGPIHPREVQHLGRQPIATERTPRLAPPPGSNPTHLCPMGCSGDRPLRNSQLSCGSSIRCAVNAGPSGNVCRCLLAEVGFFSSLGLSPSSTSSARPTSSEFSTGLVHPSDASLGERILVAGPESKNIGPSPGHNKSQEEPDRPSHKASSSRIRLSEIAGFPGSGWTSEVSGWDQSDLDLLRSSWRESTLNTYKAPWKRWLAWTSSSGVSVNNPAPKDLARFLSYLHSLNFSYSSILVHKSVVANFANPSRTQELTGHPVVRQILKAISLKRAIGLLEKREIWDVSTLISWISDHPPNQDSFFEVARHTAILLLLCSGRRVLDLTLLLSSRDGFQDLGDRAVFWPAFGSKTDTSGHRQSGWQLKQNPSNPLFDLLFWVRKLISLSSARIGKKDVKSLFFTT